MPEVCFCIPMTLLADTLAMNLEADPQTEW